MKEIIQKTIAILTKSERRKLAYLIIANTLISILDICALAVLVYIIGFYTQSGSYIHLSFLPLWLANPDSISLISLFLILFIIKSLAGYVITHKQYEYVYEVAARISEHNMYQYLNGTYHDYVSVDSAVHIRKISQQPIEFCQYILTGLQQIFTESILGILAVIAILLFNAQLFLLITLLLLPPLILVAYFTKSKLKAARNNIKTSSVKTLQHLHEALTGYVESNVNNKNSFFTQRYASYQKSLNNYLSDLHGIQGITSRLVEVFAVLGLFVIIIINKWHGHTGTADIINIGAFMAAAYKIIPSIVKISNISGQIKTYKFTLYDLEEKQIATHTTNVTDKRITSIQFNDVTYHRQEHKLLNNFNLTINTGNLMGISGASGKGKTTLINLLLGFIDIEKGEITINNAVTKPSERKDYWNDIAYVKQQSFLIYDTILNNITLFDTGYDEIALAKAITAAGLDTFIDKMSDGLNTVITENGKNISGGQRQRIALARAFYKNASLIILDEPFNELDDASESAILHHLRTLSQQGKMILLITHNRKSLDFCDKTYTIE